MSTTRLATSSLRAVSRRATPASRQSWLRWHARRTYSSSGHGGSAGAEKSSDLPWLIGSIAVTVPGAAWLLSSSPSKKTSAAHHGGAPVPDEEKAPAVEPGDSSSSSSQDTSSSSSDENQQGEGNAQAAPGGSEAGSNVPPPTADNSDMATNYEDKRGAQEQYKDMVRRGDTRMASSASDTPSKRAAAEHPREDPQKGEGEGVQKGGPA